jgi:hypothetical protein
VCLLHRPRHLHRHALFGWPGVFFVVFF